VTAVGRRVALTLLAPVLRRAGKAYLAGPTRRDAVELAERLLAGGFAVTVAYWNAPEDSRATVEAELLACIGELAGLPRHPQVAVKAPTLGFDAEAVARLAAAARAAGVGLVLDSHAPADADATLQLARVGHEVGASMGAAVPARWARSRADGMALLADGLSVRLIKGQWADDRPGVGRQGEEAMRRAYADVVEALASPAVTIATHDATLLAELLGQASWTGEADGPELELLLGLPAAPMLRLAAARQMPVRFYLAYGSPGLAFKLSSVLRRPRLAVTLAQGVLLGARNRGWREREALQAGVRVSRA
jgi:proline dehydrogenase